MARGKSKFRQSEVETAVKAVVKAAIAEGIEVKCIQVEFITDGRFKVTSNGSNTATAQNDLDAELAEFEVRHGEN